MGSCAENNRRAISGKLGYRDMLFYGECATDTGIYRKNNQDTVLLKKMSRNGQDIALGVVCDGVGGLEHGEAASRCVGSAASEWFDGIAGWIDIGTVDADILFSHFKDAAEEWNRLVREIIVSRGIYTGTTMSAVLLLRDRYFIIHVGDSRIYRYRSHLELMTTDESMAKVCDGRMKLFLMNYVGKDDILSFSAAEGTLFPGDIFLYGSDGFYHLFTESDMENICGSIDSIGKDRLCRAVIETMIQRGERDNISVGIIYCTEQ